jgi:hypothetical protein
MFLGLTNAMLLYNSSAQFDHCLRPSAHTAQYPSYSTQQTKNSSHNYGAFIVLVFLHNWGCISVKKVAMISAGCYKRHHKECCPTPKTLEVTWTSLCARRS